MRALSSIQQTRQRGNESRNASAFTLVEIAICLGIIGFALVAIIGILPAGLQVQRDNREDTIINQEGPYLLEAIRNGAKDLVELQERTEQITIEELGGTSYVFDTNDWQHPREVLGLLSTPSDVPTGSHPVQIGSGNLVEQFYDENIPRQVVAIIRAGAGAAGGDKDTVLGFKYQVTIHNFESTNSNPALPQALRDELGSQLREIRLDFRWPILANRKPGNGRHIFRAAINGPIEGIRPTNQIDRPLFLFQQE